jgi:hypothetical protein
MSRFVRPDTTTLPLSDGDWLLVKTQLNAGEQREVFNRLTRNNLAIDEHGIGGRMEIDPMQAGFSTVLGYLLDWSLTDDDGQKVEVKGQPIEVVAAAIDALDLDSYQEILDAVQRHEASVNERRLIEKKRRGVDSKLQTT